MTIDIEHAAPGLRERAYVRRYSVFARINHWITATTFVLLALSGLALFHPSLYFLTAIFGGGPLTRAIHPWLGVILLISFFGMFLQFWRQNLWNRDDTQWMSQIGDVVKGDEEKLPELGKYNAGQKGVFWGQALMILVLFCTGLVMWDQYFGGWVSIDTNRLAALTHAVMAFFAIMLIVVHVYAGIWVRGSVSSMTEGRVTGGWAWRHHRKWLRRQVLGGE